MMDDKTPLNRFLMIGTIEGLSFIVLLFVAMPLKYYAGMPQAVKHIGMIHGVLFIAFVIALMYAANHYKWKQKTILLALLLSLIPFGTFLLKKITQNAHQ